MQDSIRNIRNFCIISHINHGKSTLADRFLELTGTIEKRKMREQYLDQMELERERGITIKLQPVRMIYEYKFPIPNFQFPMKFQIPNPKLEIRNLKLEIPGSKQKFVLNLVDTPGHIDFSYEVSRALKAVEGAILLVDATQGVQAQTFSNAELAKSLGLVIIPVINKIDLQNARIDETKNEIVKLLGCEPEEILEVSAKTGQGVERLFEEIIKRISPPNNLNGLNSPRALVFDFSYSPHRGVIAYLRMMNGAIKKGDELFLFRARKSFIAREVGFFRPELKEAEMLEEGDIGYVATNIKEPATVRIGDTITKLKISARGGSAFGGNNEIEPLSGYEEPKPVVFSDIFPESQNDFNLLSQALGQLRLSDSSLTFEEGGSALAGLGRGFKCGFLGMLHLEIIAERLKREFGLKLITAAPSVAYLVERRNGKQEEVSSPALFPDDFEIERIYEPWIELKIISPSGNLNAILKLLQRREAQIGAIEQFGSFRISLGAKMALREFMRNFFDEIKSVSAGYASLSYKIIGNRETDVCRLDILINGGRIPAFSRVVKKNQAQAEAKYLVEKLREILPRTLFAIKIQAKCYGRILASASISALKKDVAGYLYGGDRTRKMKLWQKQKEGKKRMKERGEVRIPHDVFLKILKF